MKPILFCLTLFLLFSSAKSCTKDTCNDAQTFSAINLSTLPTELKVDTVLVKMDFKLKTSLPDAYFKDVMLNKSKEDRFGKPWNNDFETLTGIEMSAKGAQLKLKAAALKDGENQITLHTQLPDRQKFIECEHAGGGDAYLLDLVIYLVKKQGEVSAKDLTWKETLHKGAY